MSIFSIKISQSLRSHNSSHIEAVVGTEDEEEAMVVKEEVAIMVNEVVAATAVNEEVVKVEEEAADPQRQIGIMLVDQVGERVNRHKLIGIMQVVDLMVVKSLGRRKETGIMRRKLGEKMGLKELIGATVVLDLPVQITTNTRNLSVNMKIQE